MNKRQRLFCDEYLAQGCKDAKQAALKAGYKPVTAENASRWLDKKSTKKYNTELAEYIAERLEQISSEKVATAQELMEYFTAVVRGESRSEEIVIEGTGDGCSEARTMTKAPSEKDRLKAASELAGILKLKENVLNANLDGNFTFKMDYGDNDADQDGSS